MATLTKEIVPCIDCTHIARMELDSHADTCCIGKYAEVLYTDINKVMTVQPFLESLGNAKNVPVVTAAVAYDDPDTGRVWILIVHQALYFPEMKHHLLCPMQLRMNDVSVNERPKFLTTKPTAEDHAIISADGELVIPLDISGVSSYFPVRCPTKAELHDCTHIELTSPTPEWQPHDVVFAEEESKMLARFNQITKLVQIMDIHPDPSTLSIKLSKRSTIPAFTTVTVKKTVTIADTGERFVLTPERLAETWGIGLPAAQRTLRATTQKGVRALAYPGIER